MVQIWKEWGMRYNSRPMIWKFCYGLWFTLLFTACQVPAAASVVETQPAAETAVSPPTVIAHQVTASSTATPVPTHTPTAVPTNTPTPTFTPSPTPTATPTETPSPTPTPTPGPCDGRMPSDDLFTIITLTYGISRYYKPADLVPLANYLAVDVTLGYPIEVRQVMVEPLVQMVTDMQAAGLKPQIISGFRDYYAQSLAYQKWLELNPESASIVSAPPGHSEHQLGTVVDFGSPELPDIVGQPDIQFHTYFYQTSEGIWLGENAHKYGFTLSYTREAFEITGFYYEPWHFRYVGVEMATQLKEMGMTLTEFQLVNQPLPCVVDQ